MKTITMRIQKHSRPGVILMAAVVAIITTMVVANATQTITTPNAVSISYNLLAGNSSATITPVSNKPVLVMGCCTTSGDIGVGQVTLLHIPSGGLNWAGLASPTSSTGGAAITSGLNGNTGTRLVFIDQSLQVDIRANSLDTILIDNESLGTRTGSVTLIW